MKKLFHSILSGSIVFLIVVSVLSCIKEDPPLGFESAAVKKISLSGQIEQLYRTRVNDDGFCDGDRVGVYIVDYEGSSPGTLLFEGNRADNVSLTFDEPNKRWVSARDIYWKDDETKVDIYGYYPYDDKFLNSISAYAFELKKDQSTAAAYGFLGGYEASDFLWGKAQGIAPTASVIQVSFRHRMASVKVSLVEGDGFSDGEWAMLNKSVLVLNTKRNATIDLSTGLVTSTGDVPNTGTIPLYDNGSYRAIVVPQEVEENVPLLSISIGHSNYLFTKTDVMTYLMGKQHNFTITVDKRTDGGVTFTVVDESITPWENDNVSHDATAREYIVIHVEKAGTLSDRIVAAGKDLSKIKNLKVTGFINSGDFTELKEKMPLLQALNLKDVTIVDKKEPEIPDNALYNKHLLQKVILPDKLVSIGASAFSGCTSLSGSLILPEGLKEIGVGAFRDCRSLDGQLYLPSTLTHIGDVAFISCGFNCELLLPEGLEYIGNGAFSSCALRGTLVLPASLKHIGFKAFSGCANLTGSLTIPPGVETIGEATFRNCGFNGTLTLHDDILSIDVSAFERNKFRGELILPSGIGVIPANAFAFCDFSGTLTFPEHITSIGWLAYSANWRLSGVVDFPKNVQSIGEEAFSGCTGIEGLVFGEAVESVGASAFSNCYGISSIECKSEVPSYVYPGAFDGVAKDNFVLEVPEQSVALYQTAPGWSDFKRIAAHRELSIRPASASAINAAATRDLILRAEGDWKIESQPEWVSFNQESGTNITELKLTFAELPKGSENRQDNVVFKLIDKDYTVNFSVAQYNYDAYTEDEFVALQTASKGAGVNIVFLGDGFSAKDISEGTCMQYMTEAYNHFFDVEPYTTYQEYFNVYTAIAVSPESGIGNVNTVIDNKFNTYVLDGVTLGPGTATCSCAGDDIGDDIFDYAKGAPTVDDSNIAKTLVVIIANTADYGGRTYLHSDNRAIAYCPISEYGYPYDFRGAIQHEAGGHGFGKLADEFVIHNAFIHACGCLCCPHDSELLKGQARGWYENVSLSGKLSEVPWSHFIFHERYNRIVDVFEGAFYHSRGVYRSEQGSCMINNIPYYNAISRESIVKRIKAYAGEEYSFAEFLEKDVLDASVPTKGVEAFMIPMRYPVHHHTPVVIK